VEILRDEIITATAISTSSGRAQLLADILIMRERGMSYRQIARAVGSHWMRVQQIVKSVE